MRGRCATVEDVAVVPRCKLSRFELPVVEPDLAMYRTEGVSSSCAWRVSHMVGGGSPTVAVCDDIDPCKPWIDERLRSCGDKRSVLLK